MAKITINDLEYNIPPFNFAAIERAWPFINDGILKSDPIDRLSAGIGVIAAGILEMSTFSPVEFGIKEDRLSEDEIFALLVLSIKKRLKATETPGIMPCVDDIVKEAGLSAEEGELPQVAASLSRGIAPNSSPN